ncbi:MAG: hypothetical protein WCH61_09300 [bacterium]
MLPYDRFTASLNDARTDEQPGFSILIVAPSFQIVGEIGDFAFNGFCVAELGKVSNLAL